MINKPKITLIFSNNFNRARYKLDEILSCIYNFDIIQSDKNGCLFSNGDIIRIAQCSESSRGIRANKIYVDKDISLEVLDKIILPCLIYEDESCEQIFFY